MFKSNLKKAFQKCDPIIKPFGSYQARKFVGPDLDMNYFHMLSADDASSQEFKPCECPP